MARAPRRFTTDSIAIWATEDFRTWLQKQGSIAYPFTGWELPLETSITTASPTCTLLGFLAARSFTTMATEHSRMLRIAPESRMPAGGRQARHGLTLTVTAIWTSS